MANKKISQLTPKGSALAGTDLLEVSVFNGATYDTKSLTGANVVSGLQPTLFSGTNIKTINSTSLLGSGDIAISTGLTVGTTPITSGTVGRVLFEGTGNVVQEDSKLFWDNTNKKLGIGATPDVNTVLDVRSAGILATDLAFRVRNSANTLNAFKIQGDNEVNVRANLSLGNYAAGVTRKLYMVRDAETFGLDLDWAGANTYGARIVNNGSGTVTGLLVSAINGTRNDAIYATGGDVTVAAGKVVIGTHTATAKLDVKAGGALSTDLALRVRNSADSADILKVQGDAGIVHNGRFGLNTATSAGIDLFINAGSASSYGIYAIGTYGVAAISARPDTATTNYNFHASACARFGAYYASNTGGGTTVTGIRIGYVAESFNANTFDNIGFKCDIANSGGGAAIALDIANGNFRFGTGTGTKIGTATTQKIGFWNATPIVQPTTAVAAATVVSGAGGNVKHDDTFDGYTVEQVVRALRNTGLLA